MYFYSKKEFKNKKYVLLFGGYTGHANFGDILQLKNILNFYKMTNFEPVVFIQVSSIYDKEFISNLDNWFNTENFIFYSSVKLNLDEYDLKKIEPFSVDNFHIYGGGFLNRFWADEIINLSENIINFFNIKHYILSGQQIDDYGIIKVKEHFIKYPPNIVGVRDNYSLTLLKKYQIENSYYSFDDAFEAMIEFKKHFEQIDEDGILLQLNLSGYVSSDSKKLLDEYIKILNLVKEKYNNPKLYLILSYLDSRGSSILDTLNVISRLDYHFDFIETKIINIASLSLNYEKQKNKIKIPKNVISIVNSYHTAMLTNFLSIPTHLFAKNDYYRQKFQGLGLMEKDINSFLQYPEHIDNQDIFISARENWKKLILKAISSKGIIFNWENIKIVDEEELKFSGKPIELLS